METRTRTSSYNPGTKGKVTSEGNGRFIVQSFRNREDDWSVDLNAGTCTCPHHIIRGATCKHLEAATEESANLTREVARQLSAGRLHELLRKNASRYRPEQMDAIREVIFEKLYSLVETVSEQVRSREYCRV